MSKLYETDMMLERLIALEAQALALVNEISKLKVRRADELIPKRPDEE